MDNATARTRIESMTDAASDPVLTSSELDDLVNIAKRVDAAGNPITNVATATPWSASTTFRVNEVVTPDPADGRYWMCTVPGLSAETQPEWPDRAGWISGMAIVVDNDVEWLDVGTTWTPTFDLNAAAAAGWALKAGKAAGRFSFTTDGQTFQRGQVISACHKMERMYRRRIGRID